MTQKDKIRSLIAYLDAPTADSAEWNLATAKIFIDEMVGDPILRDALRAMYNSKQNVV